MLIKIFGFVLSLKRIKDMKQPEIRFTGNTKITGDVDVQGIIYVDVPLTLDVTGNSSADEYYADKIIVHGKITGDANKIHGTIIHEP
jgi:hypothetical protein